MKEVRWNYIPLEEGADKAVDGNPDHAAVAFFSNRSITPILNQFLGVQDRMSVKRTCRAIHANPFWNIKIPKKLRENLSPEMIIAYLAMSDPKYTTTIVRWFRTKKAFQVLKRKYQTDHPTCYKEINFGDGRRVKVLKVGRGKDTPFDAARAFEYLCYHLTTTQVNLTCTVQRDFEIPFLVSELKQLEETICQVWDIKVVTFIRKQRKFLERLVKHYKKCWVAFGGRDALPEIDFSGCKNRHEIDVPLLRCLPKNNKTYFNLSGLNISLTCEDPVSPFSINRLMLTNAQISFQEAYAHLVSESCKGGVIFNECDLTNARLKNFKFLTRVPGPIKNNFIEGVMLHECDASFYADLSAVYGKNIILSQSVMRFLKGQMMREVSSRIDLESGIENKFNYLLQRITSLLRGDNELKVARRSTLSCCGIFGKAKKRGQQYNDTPHMIAVLDSLRQKLLDLDYARPINQEERGVLSEMNAIIPARRARDKSKRAECVELLSRCEDNAFDKKFRVA